jgi:hypothetical protein
MLIFCEPCTHTHTPNLPRLPQLTVDMLADKVLFEGLKYCGVCAIACPEDNPVPLAMGGEGYSVCFDPLDCSSIVGSNFAAGTIFGVWPGNQIGGTTQTSPRSGWFLKQRAGKRAPKITSCHDLSASQPTQNAPTFVAMLLCPSSWLVVVCWEQLPGGWWQFGCG